MMCFKKKNPKKWTFEQMPYVMWGAKNKTKYENMITFCKLALTQILGITNVELIVVNNDRVITHFDSNDIEMQALLQGEPEKHKYRLNLHSRVNASNVASVVCHELIHLKQFERGELKLVEGGAMWNGKFYEKTTPYMSRPWEKEANNDMNKLEKQVKELYYEK